MVISTQLVVKRVHAGLVLDKIRTGFLGLPIVYGRFTSSLDICSKCCVLLLCRWDPDRHDTREVKLYPNVSGYPGKS